MACENTGLGNTTTCMNAFVTPGLDIVSYNFYPQVPYCGFCPFYANCNKVEGYNGTEQLRDLPVNFSQLFHTAHNRRNAVETILNMRSSLNMKRKPVFVSTN